MHTKSYMNIEYSKHYFTPLIKIIYKINAGRLRDS